MAQLLNEIQWGEPLLAPDIDPVWEAELKRRGGNVSEVDRRIRLRPMAPARVKGKPEPIPTYHVERSNA